LKKREQKASQFTIKPKNAFEDHQLCWAHPQRKLRDLAESEEFGQTPIPFSVRTLGNRIVI